MELILNIPFTTLNEYIKAERSNKHKAASLKKRQTESVAYLAKHFKFKVPKGVYDIIFTWYKPDNRTDHDNIAFCKKFVLDGLVMSGAIESDSPKFIGNFHDVFIVDKTRDYISCMVMFRKHIKSFDI
jgi:hypothetical protein